MESRVAFKIATGSSAARTRRGVLRSVAAVAGAGALPVALGACAGREEAPAVATAPTGKVVLWGWTGPGAQWADELGQRMLREFEGKNPGITVEAVNVQAGGNAGDDKFMVAAAGGEPPDLFSTGRSAVAEWGIDGVIRALDDRMKGPKSVKPEAFVPGLIEEGSWRGKVYGLSHSIDTRAFFWNKELYAANGLNPERAPETWDELVASIGKTVRQDGGKLDLLGYHPTLNEGVGAHFWQAWLWALGGSYLSEDRTRVAFNTDAGIRALEWMQRLANAQGGWNAIQEFYMPIQQATPQRPNGWLLGLKRTAQDICTGGAVKSLQDNYRDVRFGVGHIPKAPTGKRASVRGGYFLVVASQAKHPDAAWRFVEFHLSRETQVAFNDQLNRLPATNEAANSAAFLKGDANRKIFTEVAAYSQRIPAIVPGYADVLTINAQIAPKVLSGQASPRDALNTAAQEIQVVLDKWKGR